jgi:hypothetical protein
MARLTEVWRSDPAVRLAETTRPATAKVNCWEFKKCGRQPGGHKEKELGTCPVTVQGDLDGAHEGKNGGRACWVIAGSLCGGKIQGTYAQKLSNCWRCDFMNTVKKEEEPAEVGFSATRLGLERVLEKKRSRNKTADPVNSNH